MGSFYVICFLKKQNEKCTETFSIHSFTGNHVTSGDLIPIWQGVSRMPCQLSHQWTELKGLLSRKGENSSKIRGKNPSLCRLLHFPSQLLKNSTVWIMSLLNMIFSASSWQFNLPCLGEENLLFSINTKWGDEIASCIISIKMLLPSFPTSYSQHSKAQLGDPSTRK